MKSRIFCEYATRAALLICLAAMPGTVSAQNANVGAGTPMPVTRIEREDDMDYGWIGLIGLIGLAGLLGKRDTRTVHRDTDTRTKREN